MVSRSYTPRCASRTTRVRSVGGMVSGTIHLIEKLGAEPAVTCLICSRHQVGISEGRLFHATTRGSARKPRWNDGGKQTAAKLVPSARLRVNGGWPHTRGPACEKLAVRRRQPNRN